MLGVQHLLPSDGRVDPEGSLRAGEAQQDDQLLPVGAAHSHVPSLPRLRASPLLALLEQEVGDQPGDHHGRSSRVRAGVLPGDTGEGHSLHRQPDGPVSSGAAGLQNGMLHPRQAHGRTLVLSRWRPAVRQLSDIGVPRRQGDLRDERHRTAVHVGRVPRHAIPPVRGVRRRGVDQRPRLGSVGALPSRHSVRLRDSPSVAATQLRGAVRAHNQSIQREDLHIHLVLVRVPVDRQHGKPVQVARPLALLARPGALRAQAVASVRHGATRTRRPRKVHGELSEAGWDVHPASGRHEHGRGDRRRDVVRPVEQLQSGAASDRRETRSQAGG